MNKLWAGITKDWLLLTRDRVGLIFMFMMPIVLVILITSIQNNTFEAVNDRQLGILINNQDTGIYSTQLIQAIEAIGMFELQESDGVFQTESLATLMRSQDALLAMTIPASFSSTLQTKVRAIADQALSDLGLFEVEDSISSETLSSLQLYYHPVLQESYRYAIRRGLNASLQLVTNRAMISELYTSLGESSSAINLEEQLFQEPVPIEETPVSRDGSGKIPNSSQHNVPAWTVFAMFFMVISLAGNMVREKLNGSYLRLKSLPTNFLLVILSKQITYLVISILQVIIIFSIGVWLFPVMGLPTLNMPSDFLGLAVVSMLSAICAINYAICVGIFAKTQEQANGFGAASVVILAALGGILVPVFAMPTSFQAVTGISPLYWCLKAYYALFLESGSLWDIGGEVLPLILFAALLQLVIIVGLKRKRLL